MGLLTSHNASALSKNIMISAKLFINGKLISSPKIITIAGETAEISQISEEHQSIYRMKVLATNASDEKIKDGILMKFDIEANDGTSIIKSTPQVLTKIGSEATITVNGDQANQKELMLKVIATRQ